MILFIGNYKNIIMGSMGCPALLRTPEHKRYTEINPRQRNS